MTWPELAVKMNEVQRLSQSPHYYDAQEKLVDEVREWRGGIAAETVKAMLAVTQDQEPDFDPDVIRARVEDVEGAGASKERLEIVLLIHGIRTHAEWQVMVGRVLREVKTIERVIPLKYGYLDAVRFLLPGPTRRKPINRLLWRIDSVMADHREADVSVVAHSFGTYAITRILDEKPALRLRRLILCGSIVPTDYRWDQLVGRVHERVINECGSKDVWPVLAYTSTVGFGPSGRQGFGSPQVADRYHGGGHSDYFTEEFVRRFWLPWFREGKLVDGSEIVPGPWRWSILTVFRLWWLLLIVLSLLVVLGIYLLYLRK